MSPDFKARFEAMISGTMADEDIITELQRLENDGICEEHLHIGAQVLRSRMVALTAPQNAMDIVGTGGDNLSTFNISTACSFVVAGAGVPVAKHGNRAVSSKSGASDVLRELGVKLDIPPGQTELCIAKAGIGFLFAPNHHKAMGHVAKARATLGTRTIFNRLGPLCNPANVQYILLGVSENTLRQDYAKALLSLGIKRALIVHGSDGMDEITTTGPSFISEIKDGQISHSEISPEQFGFNHTTLKDLQGGNPQDNAQALRALLGGASGAYRDIVLLNSGAALYAAGKATSITNGINLARIALDNGHAKQALAALVEISNG